MAKLYVTYQGDTTSGLVFGRTIMTVGTGPRPDRDLRAGEVLEVERIALEQCRADCPRTRSVILLNWHWLADDPAGRAALAREEGEDGL